MEKLIVGCHALYSVAKAYVNILNSIATFVEPTPPTNIITNETILTQCIIKQGFKVFGKKSRLQYKNICSSSMIGELLIQISLKTSSINKKEIDLNN